MCALLVSIHIVCILYFWPVSRYSQSSVIKDTWRCSMCWCPSSPVRVMSPMVRDRTMLPLLLTRRSFQFVHFPFSPYSSLFLLLCTCPSSPLLFLVSSPPLLSSPIPPPLLSSPLLFFLSSSPLFSSSPFPFVLSSLPPLLSCLPSLPRRFLTAECCLSLNKFISSRAISHLCPLTHQGLEVGELE